MNSQLDYDDLKSFVRRRKTLCLVTFSAVFIFSIALAALLPPIFRSQATIRITENQISEEYIKSVMDYTPEQRLQSLKGAVMSYTRLQEVVKNNNLYPELQKIGAMNDAVSKLKGDIEIEPVVSNVTNPRTGRLVPVTSAILLSFNGSDPQQVKNVTQALADLYVAEDVKKRGEIVDATTSFLEGELDRLKKIMSEQETKMGNFKREHLGTLPENNAANLQVIARLERDITEIDNEVRHLEDRKISLNGQLSSVAPQTPVTTNSGIVLRSPTERLRILKMELVGLQTRLSSKHPDVRRVKRELEELERELGQKAGSDVDANQIIEEKNIQLAQLKEKFGTKHPDVVRLEQEINTLSANSTKQNGSGTGSSGSHDSPNNPAYINLVTQINMADAQAKSLTVKREQINTDLLKLRKQLSNAPIVESQLNEMTRTYENSRKTYTDLMDKLMAARVSQAVEKKDRGTKFTITEPPVLPNKPFKPNRLAIVVLGFIGGLGASFALAAIKEATDHSIKSEKELSSIADVPVLSTITYVGKKDV